MVRAAFLGLAALGACASGAGATLTESARVECQTQGVGEGAAMRNCIAQMEEAIRNARENAGAAPERPSPPR